MKSKIFTLAAITLFLVSCSTQKTAPVAATPTPEATPKAATLTPELAEGQNLYANNCAKCHKLFEPTKFTKEEWAPILVRMQKKAKLDDTQIASITNYIHSQL
ncbi:diheme cytochrome c [Flavobacterium sp. 270]|uniref:c-type cytochrome n=1 Tax=Flavobacterium sp. 270 TaxID=2512114 RepID=UPI001066BD00|nr:cytochrome c [Flavobacterium sp. 270]TDW52625.1 diheme cytochrome c [Flavobacterium sp. 270]